MRGLFPNLGPEVFLRNFSHHVVKINHETAKPFIRTGLKNGTPDLASVALMTSPEWARAVWFRMLSEIIDL